MPESYHYDRNKKNQPTKTKKLDLCIDSIIKKEGYVSCDVIKNNLLTDGESYNGNLFEIRIKGKTVDGDHETAIFIKEMASAAIDNKLISVDSVYNKELFVYNELIRVFDELQDEAEVPKNERFKRAKSYDECYSKAIILENLTNKGFKTFYRMDCVTLEMAVASITELAKFHGLSFVLKERRMEYFVNQIKTLEHPFIFGTKARADLSRKFLNTTLKYLDGDMRRKVEGKITGVLQKYSQYLHDEASKLCLCHGDYRPNNIMVKEENGKITEVIPVDYQIIHYGCPILDFYFFMYTGTDSTFRRKHLFYLKDLYYEALEKYLQYFDLPAESVYPRKVFEKEFVAKRDYGLMLTVLFIPRMFVSEGKASDVMSKEKVSTDIPLDERFRDRFIGTVKEFIELRVL